MSFVDRRREPPSFNKSSCTLSLVSIDEDDVFYSDGDKSISFPAPQSHDEDDRSEDDSIFLDELDSSSQHSGSQRSVIKTDQIVTTETRQIWCLSAFTKCVLVLATGLTAFAIFYNLRWEENQRFESMFHDHAAKTIDGIQSEFKHTVDALDNLGVTYTSHARVSGSQFPLVTLPDFEFRGPSVKSLTETKLVSFLPLVEQAYLASWEVYALVASSWVNDALEQMHSEEDNVFAVARNSNGRRELPTDQYIVDKYPGNGTPLSTVPAQSPTSPTMPVSSPMNPIPLPSPTIQPVGPPTMPPFLETLSLPEATEPVTYLENGVATTVYRIEEEPFQAIVEDLTRELYTPLWQSTPVIPKLVNYNLLSHEMFGPEVKETINTGKIVTGRAFPALEFMDATAYWGSTYKGDFINGEPSSQIYVPVFDDFGEPRQIMGVITAIFSWGDYFAGHLPSDGSESIICVLENACGQQFSYLVKGKVASFLGKGDKHSAEFDDLEESFDFATLIEDEFLTFSGVSLELEFCTYRVRIFPTREMQDLFITIKPTYYTVAVVLTFLFTVIVLGILSYLQEKRHNKVLETAAQTSAVVSSLFPAVVRDRLLQKGEKLNTVSAKRRLKTYLHKNTQKESVESKPIADLFPETTVMFADISGFTAWSSVREPTQVFTLLETIYGAFDRTAKRRNVFKVETIGDCYVGE